jgi:hypothetical protein
MPSDARPSRPIRRLLLAPLLLLLPLLPAACDEGPGGGGADAGVDAGGGGGTPDAGAGAPDGGTGEQVPPDAGSAASAPRFEHFIRRAPYPRLVLEVDRWAGYQPSPFAVQRLEAGLKGILGKDEVKVEVDGERPSDPRAANGWTFAELRQLAAESFNRPVPVGTIKMHVMLVDGVYEQRDVLGIAWDYTHLVLFRQRMDEACGAGLPLNQEVCRQTELGVWVHEVGHLLGLVNIGLPMQSAHEAEDKRAHDVSDGCIMFWAYETPDVLTAITNDVFGTDPKLGFDDACLQDIDAVKNRP